MTWYPAGERELFEELLHACFVLRDVRVDLAISAFEPRVGHYAGTAVARAHNVNHIQVTLLDHAVQMHIDEIEARRGPPMAEQARFHVLLLERLLKQRIVIEVDLADGEVVGRAPPGIHLAKKLGFKRASRSPC